jgi:hypothetical protein
MNVDMSRGLVLKNTQGLSVLGFIQVWISAGKRQLLNLGFRQKCGLVSFNFLVENSLANIDLKDLFTTPYIPCEKCTRIQANLVGIEISYNSCPLIMTPKLAMV